jgi:hypothetical protein
MKNKGQVTIFIILGVVIVAVIILFFLLSSRTETEKPADTSPKSYIQKCIKESVENSIDILLKNGGEIQPKQKISYDGENYTYLCYQADYYLSCYNLQPMLQEKIEYEIKENIKNEVQNCFNSMKEDYENQGFIVSGGVANFSVNSFPRKIKVSINKKVQISKGGNSQNFEDFSFELLSPLYELTNIAREIINSESQYCYFEYNGYMLLHPECKIWRIDYDGSKIYKIIDKLTGKEFKFAVRSCALPPGI